MDLEATIYIKTLENWDPKDDSASGVGYQNWPYGSRFFAGKGGSTIRICGRKLQRTWTLLVQDATAGDTQIFLEDDPFVMGWQVGDKIGMAATDRDGQTQGLGATSLGETHIITSFESVSGEWLQLIRLHYNQHLLMDDGVAIGILMVILFNSLQRWSI